MISVSVCRMKISNLIGRSSCLIKNSNLFKVNNFQEAHCKTLFSRESLRITSFEESRKNFIAVTDVESFKDKMREKVDGKLDYLVFLDDLKKLIMIADTDEDLNLLLDVMKKFCMQTNVLRFGSFKLGPEVMRLYYILNKPKEALKLVQDKETWTAFNQITSFLILGDLLFESKMYEEVIQFFHLIVDRQLQGKKFPPKIVILYLASCYKLNTPESLDGALKMWNIFLEVGFRCPMRGIWFLSALAIKQNQPDLALEIIAHLKQTAVGDNIKLLALSDKKQYDKVLNYLKEFLYRDTPKAPSISKFITGDSLKHLEKSFENSTEENIKNLAKLKEELIAHNFVKKEFLDAYLFEEIVFSFERVKTNSAPYAMRN